MSRNEKEGIYCHFEIGQQEACVLLSGTVAVAQRAQGTQGIIQLMSVSDALQ